MISELFQQALDLYYQGHLEEAETILLDLIRKDPASERALILLVNCSNSIDRKIVSLRKVVELNPNNYWARQSLDKLETKARAINKKKLKHVQRTEEEHSQQPKEETGKRDRENGKKKVKTTDEKHKGAKKKSTSKKENPDSTAKKKVTNTEELPYEKDISVEPTETAKDSPNEEANNKKGMVRTPHRVTIPEPEYVKRSPEDDFFHGFREGIEPISRMETGMYGKNMVVSGIHFSLYDGPPCLRIENSHIDTECDICEFYAPQNCLLRLDTFLLEDINRFTGFRADITETFARKRRLIVKTLYRELKTHGRPLHYTVIAKIMMGRHPKFRLKARNIYRYLSWHPELFERVDDGVYRAK